MTKKYKVMVVDDHDIVRMGLVALLEESEFDVVCEAGGAIEAVAKARMENPDIILMDVRLPDGSGVDACRQILRESPSIRVLMLTSYTNGEALMSSIQAGASGYILKQIGREALREAISKVVKGETILDPNLTKDMFNQVRNQSGEISDKKELSLTKKEREVLLEVAKGKGNKQIAQDLYLSEYTVRNYVSSILDKLNLTSRIQIAQYVYERGLNQS